MCKRMFSLCVFFLVLVICHGDTISNERENDYYQNKLKFDQTGTPEYFQLGGRKVINRVYNNIPLANTVEIKLFIYAVIIQRDIDFGVDYHNREYRYIWEPDFNYIEEVLQKKYLGIKLIHGRQSFAVPEQKDSNLQPGKIEDGLDYSTSYIYQHGIVLWQLGEIHLSDDGQEIKIHVTMFRSWGDASESVYYFKRKGKYWFFHSSKLLWLS